MRAASRAAYLGNIARNLDCAAARCVL